MEIIGAFVGLAFLLAPIIGAIALVASFIGKNSLSQGEYCEKLVSRNLHRLDPNFYTVIDNVILPSNGNTSHTQIDHIVVSRFGIFCIETKSHSGWVYGSTNQKYWTQSVHYKKYDIYNPSWQNYAHTKAIELLLGQNLHAPIVPLVVFPKAERIIVRGTNSVGNIEETLQSIDQRKTRVYSQDEYERIVQSINTTNKNDQQSMNSHKMEVRALVNSNNY